MKNCFNIIAMRKILLFVCLLGVSVLSYAQCVVTSVNNAGANTLRDAAQRMDAGNCNSIVVQTTGTIVLDSPIEFRNNSGTPKTVNLSGVTISTTLEGNYSPNAFDALRVLGSNYTFTDVLIRRTRGNGINVENSSNITIQNSQIYEAGQSEDTTAAAWAGIEAYGYAPRSRGDIRYAGIKVNRNVNGFLIQNNVVSGNNGSGILVEGNTNGSSKVITGNKVGVTAVGENPYGNFGPGIRIVNSSTVKITSNQSSANGNFSAWSTFTEAQTSTQQNAGLQTSYHLGCGIELDGGQDHIVQGNFIGTNSTGSSEFTGTKRLGNQKHGIYLRNGTRNNLIGGEGAGEGNIVGGNGFAFAKVHTSDSRPGSNTYLYGVGHGIQIDGASSNRIYGNFVGFYNGNCIENSQDAMSILGYAGPSQFNLIGGGSPVQMPGKANIFTGGKFGVFIQGSLATDNTIAGNFVGTNSVTGAPLTTGCVPAEGGIVLIAQASKNIIGTPGVPNYIANIVGPAVSVRDNGSVSNTIQGNEMKCNSNGIALLTNGNNNYASNAVRINAPTSKGLHLEGFTLSPTDRIDIYIADTTCGFKASELCQNKKVYGGATLANVQGLKHVKTITAKTDTKFIPSESAFWEYDINPVTDGKLSVANAVVTATQFNGTVYTNTSQFNTCSERITCEPELKPEITQSATGFCPGNSVVLSTPLVAEQQYTWFRNGVKIAGGSGSTLREITVSQAGNYTVKIANTLDTVKCAAPLSDLIKVDAFTTPTAPSITGNDIVCTATIGTYSAPTTFATYTWSLDPATNTSPALSVVQGTNPYQASINFGTAIGTRTLRLNVTSQQGCTSTTPATKTITIRSNPTISTADLSASPTTVCVGTNSSVASSKAKQSFETVTWTKFTGPGTSAVGAITTPASTSSTITNLSLEGTYTYRYSVTNDACATPATADVSILVKAQPVATSAGLNDTICLGGTAKLTGQAHLSDQTVLWTAEDSGTINSPNSQTTTIDDLSAGINKFSYQIKNDVCPLSAKAIVSVIVQQPSVATFTDPLNYLKQTQTAGASIAANLPPNYSGDFTKLSGAGDIIGPLETNGGEISTNIDNLLFDGDSILVLFTLTDVFDVCPETVDSALVVRAEVGSVTFKLDSICESNTAEVTEVRNGSRALESYESGRWLVAESDPFDFENVVPLDSTRMVPDFSAGAGTYTYMYQITNNNTGASEKGPLTIVVSAVSSPAVILSPDTVICVGNHTLKAQAVAAGNVVKWSPLSAASSNISSTTALETTLQNIPESNTVSYIWSVKNGVCPTNRDTVFVTRTKKLTSANPTVSSEDSLCEGMIANVTGSLPDTTITPKERGVWSIVQGSGAIEKPNYFKTNISQLGVGDNIVQYKIGNGVCTSDSATVTIVIDEKPDTAKIDGSNALVICDDEYQLKAVEPNAGNGLWTTSNTAVGISDPDSSSTLVTNLPEAEEVTFTWTVSSDLKKCVSPSATVKITRSLDLTQVDAGANQVVCNGQVVKLTGTPRKSSETSEWSLVPANSSVSFSSATNSDSTRVTGLTVGVHKFYYTIRNGVCNDAIDSVTVDIKPLPTGLDITAASDTLVCNSANSTGEFFATGTNASEFIWTLPSGTSEQSASANKDQITVEFSEGTATQKVYVSAVSEFNCASAGRDSMLVKRLVIPTPDINTGNKSCSGVENKIFVIDADSNLVYTWSNSEGIPMNVMNDTITLITPENDYTVSVTATNTDLSCEGMATEPVEVFDIIETSLITGLNPDDIINQDGKCEVKDERFPSTTMLTVNVTPSSLTLADLTFEWQRILNNDTTEFPANTTNKLNIDYSLLTPGEYRYRVIVGNKNCADNELEAIDDIELLASVPVDYKLSDNTISCVEEEVIFGVRNNGAHDDNVKYTWYHNNHSIKTDLDFFYNPILNRRDSSLLILQIDTIPLVNDTVFDSSFDYKNHTTYYEIIDGKMAYDNYKIIGKKGEKIVVKAQPEYCIVYDKDIKSQGEYLLLDTVMTSDYVLNRPGAVATAFDLNTLLGITVDTAFIDLNGYVIEYDELAIDKVEDRFALYDVTNKGGVEPNPLIRNWYVVDENGDYSQADITSSKEVLAYPNPVNRPELITYRLVRGNGVCKDSNDVNVKINYLPWPPNAFSPNGDGYYDKFEITNVDKYEGTTVTIFNRWGTEIVKINDYHLEENWWDGTKGGDALPTGGYFYLIDFNNGTDPVTGAISLIK